MKIVNINKLKLLVVKTLIIVLVFTTLFSLLPNEHWNNMNNEENIEQSLVDYIFNRIYFVMTTFSTTGFGDISPVSKYAKICTMLLQLSVVIMVIDHITL
jgi:hypothetical protein